MHLKKKKQRRTLENIEEKKKEANLTMSPYER